MKSKAKKKTKPTQPRKRTGWSVASAAGKLLAKLKKGYRITIHRFDDPIQVDITDRIERICASALGQAESSGRRKRK